MNSGLTLRNTTNFTDFRPFCIIENDLMNQAGAKSWEDYKTKLQLYGYEWYTKQQQSQHQSMVTPTIESDSPLMPSPPKEV